MAFIRTWTYITHHTRWLDDARAWQEQARFLEDSLSDALHEKLVRRFVDVRARRSSSRASARGAFAQQLQQAMAAAPDSSPTASVTTDAWIDSMVQATDDRFGLGEGTQILGDGRVLGRMSRGADRLHPEVSVTLDDLGPGAKLRLQRRLVAWTRDLVAALLQPLRDEQLAKLRPAARGVLYQLEQGLGTALASDAYAQLRQIDPGDRSRLGRFGIRLGRRVLFSAALLRPEPMMVRAALCEASLGPGIHLVNGRRGALFLLPSNEVDDETYVALGYPLFGGVAIRADEVEPLVAHIAGGWRQKAIAQRLGCDLDVAGAVFDALHIRRR
jgi:ATP-dependent RNA helicase SUPV3L1/SUV3